MRTQHTLGRLLSLLLLLVMLSGMLPAAALAGEADGPVSPTATGTVVLSEPQDLSDLAGKEITGAVELANDIDMTGRPMTPIKALIGLFEGNGYTISNLSISGEIPGRDYGPAGAGLIAFLSGTVQNLTLDHFSISGSTGTNAAVGAFAGLVDAGEARLIRCGVTGNSAVSGASSGSSCYTGGLVGDISGSDTHLFLTECYNEGSVTSASYAGGLLGRAAYGAGITMENCYALGDVNASASTSYAGGILGFGNNSFTVSASNVYVGGKVTGANKNGFAYVSRYGTKTVSLTNCYYDSTKNPDPSAYSKFEPVPGNSSCLAGTMTAKATADFAALAESLGKAFVHAGAYPVLAWTQALGTANRGLTFTVPGASAVRLEKGGRSYPLTKNGDVFTAAGLDSGAYAYYAISGDTTKDNAEGTLIIGRADKEARVTLPEKAIETKISVSPSDAKLTLQSGGNVIEPENRANDVYTYALMSGAYRYTAEAFGYEPSSGSIEVPGDGTSISVALTALPAAAVTFTVDCGEETPAVTVYPKDNLSFEMRHAKDNSLLFNLPAGGYLYEVKAPGYKPASGSFEVAGTDAVSLPAVSLEANPVWDGTQTNGLKGKGTQADPFRISNGRELAHFADTVNDILQEKNAQYANAYVELTGNIDLGDISWTPIGKNSVSPFKGRFDGKGHTIRGLNVEKSYAYYGLFGCLTDAAVENLTVAGEIYCPEPYGLAGGLSGAAKGNVTVRNCANLATVSSLARGSGGIGGLIGSYDDNVEYKWQNVRLLIENSYNAGLILATGSDADAAVGGLVGANKNCVQLANCYNIGLIHAPGLRAGGLLGDAGWQTGDDYYPSLTSCYNAGQVTGLAGKTFALYSKGTIAQSRVQNCYALENAAPAVHNGVRTVSADELKTLSLGGSWAQDDAKNKGFPYLTGAAPAVLSAALKTEADQYGDVLSFSSSAKRDDTLDLAAGAVSSGITVTFGQNADDMQKGYLDFSGGKVKLAKINEGKEAVTETATMRLSDGTSSLRKPISIVIYPSGNPAKALMDGIAATYVSNSGEWNVFDMAAYKALYPAAAGTSESARQNYLNLTINALAGKTALSTDRAKAEIILNALGCDSTRLSAFDSQESYDNAAALRKMNLGGSCYAAPWILLADQQGNVQLSGAQRKNMVNLLLCNQGENGLFYSIWGNEKYDDVDTTGTALAALARFYLAEDDSLGVKAGVNTFVNKAIDGLKQAQGANGSYGNINSDAMVIIGLAALGQNPADFIKNGCTLADAPLLYANKAGNGFTSPYLSGAQGEKAAALATEQGFRALVALDGLNKNAGKAFNIYDAGSWNAPGARQPAQANDQGTPEVTPGGGAEPGTGSEAAANILVGFTLTAGEGNDWISSSSFTVGKGSTVCQLFAKVLADHDMTSVGADKGYVQSISKNGLTLAQFDQGPRSGWIYKVNGATPAVGIQDYTLQQGDQVLFYYTKDWSAEPGASPWGPSPSVPGMPAQPDDPSRLTPAVTAKNGFAELFVSASDMSAAIAGAKGKESGDIVIEPVVSGKAIKAAVELPKASVSAIGLDTGANLTVRTPVGGVTIPNGALASLAAQAAGSTITVSVEAVETKSLTAEQQKLAGNGAVFAVSITSGGQTISGFGGKAIAVSLPYTLKTGETAESVAVWQLDDAGKLTRMACTYDKTTGLVAFSTTHLFHYVVGYNGWTHSFTDVKEENWFYDAVKYMVQKELFTGTSATAFRPDAGMTRAMLVTVLYRLEGSPAVTAANTFTDVKAGAWYADALLWAGKNGIVSGYGGGLFGTDDPITREQMAAILYRYAGCKAYDTAAGNDLSGYIDAKEISTWALDAMTWANAEELCTGRTANTLVPAGKATRAEAAAILMRFMEGVVK